LDTFTKEQRSNCMSRIRSKNTKPEIAVRKILYRSGFRYRLHRKDLPGKPDIVLPKNKIAFFINGCFWHQHEGCSKKSFPKSNTDYWKDKFKNNISRQNRDIKSLEDLGWKVCLIWECETKKDYLLEGRIKEILYGQKNYI